jgi:hypothetical protein
MTQRRLLRANGVVSMMATKPPVAISIPGTISPRVPQPARMPGVAPIKVIVRPPMIASAPMTRMTH